MTIILVTGANRGIGFAIAQSTARRIPSATIVIGCRSVEAGSEAAEQLRSLGLKATFDVVQIDVENDKSIIAAMQTVEQRFGRLDGKHIILKTPIVAMH